MICVIFFIAAQAVDTSPCATIKCSVGYRCMVDNITGTGYCDPSCDLNNGGCPADQQCVLKQVQCITSPCPPVVECTEGLSFHTCTTSAIVHVSVWL